MTPRTRPNLGLNALAIASQTARFHRDGIPIDHGTACAIARDATTVDTPALRDLDRSGAINPHQASAEIQHAIARRLTIDPDATAHPAATTAALTALLGYVLHYGNRPSVATWEREAEYRTIACRYTDDSPHRQPETYPWGSQAGIAELIARQRANYAPAFTARLDADDSELIEYLTIHHEPQLGQVPAMGWFAGGMLVTDPDHSGHAMYAWTPGDFAALVYGLRCASIDSPTRRTAARAMLTQIASFLAVTFSDPAPALATTTTCQDDAGERAASSRPRDTLGGQAPELPNGSRKKSRNTTATSRTQN